MGQRAVTTLEESMNGVCVLHIIPVLFHPSISNALRVRAD